MVADAAVAAAVALLALPDALSGNHGFVLSLAPALPLAWRRRAPLAAFAAIALVTLAQWLAGFPATGALALLLALYSVAVHERRRWAFPAAIAVVEIGALITTVKYNDGQPATTFLVAFFGLSAFVVAASALGFYVRTRRDHIAALTDRARRLEIERDQQARLAAAAERTRIARELHDVVAHNLTVMIALADGAQLAPHEAADAMRGVSSIGREALQEMRRLLGVLREDDRASELQPQPGLDQLGALVEQVRGAGLPTTLTTSGRPVPLSPGAQLTVYRVVQEALTNTLKHAPAASAAQVRLQWDPDALAIEVSDDGTPAANGGPGGHGIAGMRERLAVFGADVEAGPRPHGGWRVRTRLPIGDGR